MAAGIRRPAGLTFLFILFFTNANVGRAVDSEIVYSPDGTPVFEFRYRAHDDEGHLIWDIRKDEYNDIRQALRYGTQYWAETLEPGLNNSRPVPILVYGDDDQNDSAYSPTSPITGYTEVGAMLIKGWQPGKDRTVGQIAIGNWTPYFGSSGNDDPAYYYNGPITHLPRNGDQMHLASTMLHEITHALGVGVIIRNNTFPNSLTLWGQHLRDANGNPALPGQTISSTDTPGTFYVPDIMGRGPTFVGKNVMEVLDGAMPAGIPLWGWESGRPEFSHIELRNSMMAHGQDFQNYTTLMEAELAVMQDLGYTIDRKKYFGRSIYRNNITLVNELGFNSDATAGVGLHVYGTGNSITQAADISSAGDGGIGIRVDGWDNHITIAPDVKVNASGASGIGVAFAYGKNHTLNHRGTITAAERGLSFDFGSNAQGDYLNTRGSWIYMEVEDDGSRSAVSENAEWSLLGNSDSIFNQLNGALADTVDISGSIDAPQAIYIAENAYVANINILNGASIKGDIVSDWRLDRDEINTDVYEKYFQTPDDADGNYGDYGQRNNLLTTLSFGQAMDADGNSLDSADHDFNMKYDGDIHGQHSMVMHVVGGELEYNGSARLLVVSNQGELSGTGTYEVAPSRVILPVWDYYGDYNSGHIILVGKFNNANTLAPGKDDEIGTMTVRLNEKEYSGTTFGSMFTSTGTVAFNFNPDGEHSSLKIEGLGTGADHMVGIENQRLLTPLAGFYENGKTITIADDKLVQVLNVSDYTDTSVIDLSYDSRTLKFFLTSEAGINSITSSRQANAYASLLSPASNSGVGDELDRIIAGSSVTEDLRRVYATLDFTNDLSVFQAAGQSMTPVFEQSIATALLQNQFTFNHSLFENHDNQGVWFETASSSATASLPPGRGDNKKEGVFFFFSPSGGGGSQYSRGWDNPGYSFWQAGGILGVERHTQGGMYGAHLIANYLRLDGRGSEHELKSTGIYLGLHGRYDPSFWNGGYFFGSARAGVDIAKQRREVVVGQERGVNKSDWTAFAASAQLGGGYDFTYDRVSFGPLASLEYALNHRPSHTESEGLANLDYQANTFNSLRTNLGARASWELTDKCSISFSAAWTHELLDKMGTVQAGFAGYGNSGISFRAKTAGRDSLTTTLGVSFAVGRDISLSMEGGAELFKNGYNSGWGGFTFSKRF